MSKKQVYLIERGALPALMENEVFSSGTMLGSVRETLEKTGTAENAGKRFILYDKPLEALKHAAEETTLLALKKKHGAELVLITGKNQVSSITQSTELQTLAQGELSAITKMGHAHGIEQ